MHLAAAGRDHGEPLPAKQHRPDLLRVVSDVCMGTPDVQQLLVLVLGVSSLVGVVVVVATTSARLRVGQPPLFVHRAGPLRLSAVAERAIVGVLFPQRLLSRRIQGRLADGTRQPVAGPRVQKVRLPRVLQVGHLAALLRDPDPAAAQRKAGHVATPARVLEGLTLRHLVGSFLLPLLLLAHVRPVAWVTVLVVLVPQLLCPLPR